MTMWPWRFLQLLVAMLGPLVMFVPSVSDAPKPDRVPAPGNAPRYAVHLLSPAGCGPVNVDLLHCSKLGEKFKCEEFGLSFNRECAQVAVTVEK